MVKLVWLRHMIINKYSYTFISFIFSLSACYSSSSLRLHKYFSSHMVLQQDAPINIFGNSMPNEVISVKINDDVSDTRADKDGNWAVEISDMGAGGPYVMEVIGHSDTLRLIDIYIGDIWFCAGQSNMGMKVGQDQPFLGSSPVQVYDKVRFFLVPNDFSDEPSSIIERGQWLSPCEISVGSLPALPLSFSSDLYNKLQMPLGIVVSSWGGSLIEHWMMNDTLSSKYPNQLPNKSDINQLISFHSLFNSQKLQFPDLELGVASNNDCEFDWSTFDFDDSSWLSTYIPSIEQSISRNFVGINWYRRDFEINENNLIGDISLVLGYFNNKSATIWVNGQLIENDYLSPDMPSIITLPSTSFRVGRNQISIRLENYSLTDGIKGLEKDFYFKANGTTWTLSGVWKSKLESIFEPGLTVAPPNISSCLFNKMVYPFRRIAIKGIVWYQGEGNVKTLNEAFDYRYKLENLIFKWRQMWNDDKLPFIVIQLPNYGYEGNAVRESNWAYLRDSQSYVFNSWDDVYGLVTIGLGQGYNIHPNNKSKMGENLSKIILNNIYDKISDYDNTVVDKYKLESNVVILKLSNSKSIFCSDPYNYINGFSIADTHGRYHWAKAVYAEDSILVWHDNILSPTAIRYAWSDNPSDLNMYFQDTTFVPPFNLIIKENKVFPPEIESHRIFNGKLLITLKSNKPILVGDKYGYVRGCSISNQEPPYEHYIRASLINNELSLDLEGVERPFTLFYDETIGNIINKDGMKMKSFDIKVDMR